MTKGELINIVANKMSGEASKKVVKDVLNYALDVMKEELIEKEGSVKFRGFGAFKAEKRKGKLYTLGFTPEKRQVQTRDRIVVKFRPASDLKKYL